jgi:glycosyltransferase involved in cell wall biosynthesis
VDVSVVIPTFNRWNLLRRALDGALAQTDVELEVVVVDDASADETAARLSAIADPRLTVLRQPENRGVSAARNLGLECASGTWVSFLDDDDVWSPRRLRTLLDLAAGRNADLVLARTIVLDERGRPEAIDVVPEPPSLRTAMRITNAIGSPSGALIRRDAALRAGGFDERFSVLADWDFWLRLLDVADVAISPEVLGAYTAHPDGMHARNADAAVEEFRVLREAHAPGGGGFETDEFMRWIGRAHRRAGRRRAGAVVYLRLLRRTHRLSDAGRAALALLGERPASALRRRVRRPPDPPAWLVAAAGGGAAT